jgi:UDP-N-acetylmuramoylalanine--D-glutamate ligase
MGLGLFGGGGGAARYLVRRGARVTVTDLRGPDVLAPSLAALEGLPIRYHLGGHDPADFHDADLVVANPAVPSGSRYLEIARKRGVPIESEITLFARACRGTLLGVTGSVGKTTTVAMLAAIVRAAGLPLEVGGNLGISLLDQVEAIEPGSWVLLELSSFQLEALDALGISPYLAVITNFAPNHLDRHPTLEAYATAKCAILRHQSETDHCVLNADDAEVRSWADRTRARLVWASCAGSVERGAWLADGQLWLRGEEGARALLPTKALRVCGEHNVANALCAAAAAGALRIEDSAIIRGLCSFDGLPHRLERVEGTGHVRCYNDSKATTMLATRSALATVGETLHLIVGGAAKGADLAPLAEEIACRAQAVYAIGEAGPVLAAGVRDAAERMGRAVTVVGVKDLEAAVMEASRRIKPGEALVLSPACASTDQFANFEARGERFRRLVRGAFGDSRTEDA